MVCSGKRGLQKLVYYLHNAQFVIKAGHKALKYLLESPMQIKKIQIWALIMSKYNCSIGYIEGTTKTCADLLSRNPDKVNETQNSDEEADGDQTVLDVNDNLFEIYVLDSNQFNRKSFASCNLPDEESSEKCDCSDFRKCAFDMKVEHSKNDDLLEIRPIKS